MRQTHISHIIKLKMIKDWPSFSKRLTFVFHFVCKGRPKSKRSKYYMYGACEISMQKTLLGFTSCTFVCFSPYTSNGLRKTLVLEPKLQFAACRFVSLRFACYGSLLWPHQVLVHASLPHRSQHWEIYYSRTTSRRESVPWNGNNSWAHAIQCRLWVSSRCSVEIQ